MKKLTKEQKAARLAAMRKAYAPKETSHSGSYNNYYPFWLMENGQKVVLRFLPDKNEENVNGFLLEKIQHKLTINGKDTTVPCLSMYGEECPICKVSADYYAQGDDVNGKRYWKKRTNLAQAIILEDPLPVNEDGESDYEGKVKYLSLTYQIINLITEAIRSDELEAMPDDLEDGYDFTIKKSAQGDYSTYLIGTKFANKPRPLTPEELELVEEYSIDLSTLLPENPGLEKVQRLLNADLLGENNMEDDEPFEQERTQSKNSTSKVATKSSVAAANDDDNDDDNEDDDDKSSELIEKENIASNSADDEDEDDIEDLLAAIKKRNKA